MTHMTLYRLMARYNDQITATFLNTLLQKILDLLSALEGLNRV